MKVSVIGTGYVGLVTGTCLAEVGHNVICVDIDKEKIKKLQNGLIPIYEPGLQELVTRNKKEKRLQFTTDVKKAIQEADIVFSAVGTPPGQNHEADLKFMKDVARNFGRFINGYKMFIVKSTVPVGTSQLIIDEILTGMKEQKKTYEFDIVSNPEFLREGTAVKDFMNPDRIIIGLINGKYNGERKKKIRKTMEKIYEPIVRIGSPLIFTDIKSSEIIKYASNAFLATKISFINEIANFCDQMGGDVKEVAKGIGLDKRIGPKFLHAGVGYGGSCFPKDVKALIQTGKRGKYEFQILEAVGKVNTLQRKILFQKIQKALKNLKGKNIAIWGLAFKPKTDDMREAPALDIIKKLLEEGARIRAFDPVAEENAKKMLGTKNITYCQEAYETCKGSDALVVMTEWDEFRILNFEKLKKAMKERNIIDGRNIYEREDIEKEGFEYICFGR